MSFEEDGYLTTDEKSPGGGGDTLTWSTETDWDNAQDSEDVEIDGDSFQLASAINMVDDFEDGDVDEYDAVEGPGNGEFVTVTGTVYEGDHAARFESYDGSTSTVRSYDDTGDPLPYYPYWGDDVESYHYPDTDDSRAKIVIGVDGEWKATVQIFVGEWFGITFPDGSSVEDSSPGIPTGEWCRVEWETNDNGDGEARLYDSNDNEVSSVSGNSDTADIVDGTRYFGFDQSVTGGGDSRAFWDYVRSAGDLYA